MAFTLGIKIPEKYSFTSIKSIINSIKDLPPLDEGYVCYIPENGWRIKIKNPSYLAAAHLRSNGLISTKRIIFLVCSQDHEEYLGSFPEDRYLFEPYIKAFHFMEKYVDNLDKETIHIKDRKQFALAVKGPVQHIMFKIRDGVNIYETVDKMSINAKEKLLETFKRYIS